MPLYSERLLSRRQALGMTQKDVAQAIGVKNYQQYASWETGEHRPSVEYVEKLALALHCSTDYLLGLVNDPGATLEEADLTDDERGLLRLMRKGDYREAIDFLLGRIPALQANNPVRPLVERDDKPTVPGTDEAA
jgi:transcriptional regulator with XRE-family HTH domain